MALSLDCENLLECVFGFNSLDMQVFKALCMGAGRIEEIKLMVKRGESAIYKSLQRLIAAGVAYRRKVLINGGGYYFVYKPLPKEKIAEQIERIVNEVCLRTKKALEEFLDDSSIELPGMRNLQ